MNKILERSSNMNFLMLTLIFFFAAFFTQEESGALVSNAEEFNAPVKITQAGTVILMANGTWEVVEQEVKGVVEKGNRRELLAETSGVVIPLNISHSIFSDVQVYVDHNIIVKKV
ncbi:MAG: hypothetical protein ABJG41_04615 [Cyclobacteriaceae bacterium]